MTAQAAAADQTIHALLSKAARAAKYHLDRSHASDIPSPSTSTLPFAPPSLASAPLIRTEDRPVALVALEALVVSIQHGQGTEVEKNSAKIVKAYGLYALGDFAVALGELSGVNKEAPNGSWESYDLTLAVLANLVEGTSWETDPPGFDFYLPGLSSWMVLFGRVRERTTRSVCGSANGVRACFESLRRFDRYLGEKRRHQGRRDPKPPRRGRHVPLGALVPIHSVRHFARCLQRPC